VFQKLKQDLLSGNTTFSKALPEALPLLRGNAPDEALIWLSNELQGYQNALDFYRAQKHDLPAYRVVRGSIYLMMPDGSMQTLNHPYAQRPDFFLSAPINWVEDFSKFDGNESIVEMAEFASFFGGLGGAGVVCVCNRSELVRVIATFRNEFIRLLDYVMAQQAKKEQEAPATPTQG